MVVDLFARNIPGAQLFLYVDLGSKMTQSQVFASFRGSGNKMCSDFKLSLLWKATVLRGKHVFRRISESECSFCSLQGCVFVKVFRRKYASKNYAKRGARAPLFWILFLSASVSRCPKDVCILSVDTSAGSLLPASITPSRRIDLRSILVHPSTCSRHHL